MPVDPGRLLLADYLRAQAGYASVPPPAPGDPARYRTAFGLARGRWHWHERALARHVVNGGREVAGRLWVARAGGDGRLSVARLDRPRRCPPSMRVRDPRQERSPQ